MLKSKVTITDVAKAAGVSSSAVSYALNGKPGVSDETREKVLKVADQLGWRPNKAAKSLSDAKTRVAGLVLTYDPLVLSVEPFGMELITGLTSRLEQDGYSLLIRESRDMQSELSVLSEWIATDAVDGVFIQNLELADPRVDLFREHPEMPVLVMGDTLVAGGLPLLRVNERPSVRAIVQYCKEQGHRCIARVGGLERFGHTFIRDTTFMEIASQEGIRYTCLHADGTPDGGRACTDRLLSLSELPTAIIYDNDVMAVASLRTIRARGLRIPQDISVISWENSFMCEVSWPGITALDHNVLERGRRAAGMMLDLIAGLPIEPITEPDEQLIVRGSSGSAKE